MEQISTNDFTVIIPTANRRTLLNDTLFQLSNQSIRASLVVVIEHQDDISDDTERIVVPPELEEHFVYLIAEKASAAVQRNQGLDYVSSHSEGMNNIIFFHDDDLSVPNDYFEKLSSRLLDNSELVGVSGLALPGQSSNEGFLGLMKILLGLDSRKGGRVLRNTVNVPFKANLNYNPPLQESEWLIGCSAWRASEVVLERFEGNFKGQSISEDVIFSLRMSSRGKLSVDTSVRFTHLESRIGRDNQSKFLRNWMINHRRIISLFPDRKFMPVLLYFSSLVLIHKFVLDCILRGNFGFMKDYISLNQLAVNSMSNEFYSED